MKVRVERVRKKILEMLESFGQARTYKVGILRLGVLEPCEILWNPVESCGILWDPVESFGILWYVLKPFALFRDRAKSSARLSKVQ